MLYRPPTGAHVKAEGLPKLFDETQPVSRKSYDKPLNYSMPQAHNANFGLVYFSRWGAGGSSLSVRI
jgi:hypothetical protein